MLADLLRWILPTLIVTVTLALLPQLKPHRDALKALAAALVAAILPEQVVQHAVKRMEARKLSVQPPPDVPSDGGTAEDEQLRRENGLRVPMDGQPNQRGTPYDPDPTGGEG